MRWVGICLFAMTACFTTGCATVFQGTTQAVEFTSDPPGAKVTVAGKTAVTPAKMTLDRNLKDLDIQVEKAGYESVTQPLKRSLTGWFWANLLFTYGIGAVVDLVNGAAWEYFPSMIYVKLNPAGGGPPGPAGAPPYQIASAAEPAPTPTPAATPAPPPQPAAKPVSMTADAIPRRRQYALVIGINDYPNFNKLNNAVADARAVGAVLRERYGFQEVRELYDQQATKAGVMSAVEQLIGKLAADDDVLIFFSGHGQFNEALQRGYWVPVDAKDEAGFIPNSEISDYVKAMDAREAGHVLIIADSCFSGSYLETQRDSRAIGVRPAAGEPGAQGWIGRLSRSRSRRVLTSGSNQPVLDGGGGSHSIFTKCLLDYMENPEFPVFTESELYVKLTRNVGVNSEQAPRYGPIKYTGDMAGEFVFQKKE